MSEVWLSSKGGDSRIVMFCLGTYLSKCWMIFVCICLVCSGERLFRFRVCRASLVRICIMMESFCLKCVSFILLSVCGRVKVCSGLMLYWLLLLLLFMYFLISSAVTFFKLLS